MGRGAFKRNYVVCICEYIQCIIYIVYINTYTYIVYIFCLLVRDLEQDFTAPDCFFKADSPWFSSAGEYITSYFIINPFSEHSEVGMFCSHSNFHQERNHVR